MSSLVILAASVIEIPRGKQTDRQTNGGENPTPSAQVKWILGILLKFKSFNHDNKHKIFVIVRAAKVIFSNIIYRCKPRRTTNQVRSTRRKR